MNKRMTINKEWEQWRKETLEIILKKQEEIKKEKEKEMRAEEDYY